MSNSLRLHELQYARLPCPSLTPGSCSNSCLSTWWCRLTISSSIVPFSSYLQSFPASGSFPMSQFFGSGGQSIEASTSTSVLPMVIQDWFPLELTNLISFAAQGPFRYDINQIPYDLTVEIMSIIKGLYLVDRVLEELQIKVCNFV